MVLFSDPVQGNPAAKSLMWYRFQISFSRSQYSWTSSHFHLSCTKFVFHLCPACYRRAYFIVANLALLSYYLEVTFFLFLSDRFCVGAIFFFWSLVILSSLVEPIPSQYVANGVSKVCSWLLGLLGAALICFVILLCELTCWHFSRLNGTLFRSVALQVPWSWCLVNVYLVVSRSSCKTFFLTFLCVSRVIKFCKTLMIR